MLMGISVIIPVYNSEKILADLVARLAPVLASLSDRYELILVNDGSRDRSWDVVRSLAAQHPWVRGVNHMRNYGQHNAVLCGINHAAYEVLVTMDDDLQHPPEAIPALLQKLQEGYDVVYGTPQKEQQNFWRNLASRATKLTLANAMGADTASKVGPYRCIRSEVTRAFAHYQNPYVNIDALLTWGTTRFATVPVEYAPRKTGVSNYTLRKLIVHALNMTTGFSTIPLQLTSVVGFLFTIFGLVILLYVVGRYMIWGGSPAGFPFLASIIAIFSGAQLFALGIFGEYLARMYQRSMDRPTSVVREEIGFQEDRS